MKVYGVVPNDVYAALNTEVAPEFDDNIRVNDLQQFGGPRSFGVRFTLRTVRSDGPGARRTPSGRRSTGACWHVHLAVLDRLAERAHHRDMLDHFRITSALVNTQKGEDYIAVREALLNSQHHNAGSEMEPKRIIDLCDCEKDD